MEQAEEINNTNDEQVVQEPVFMVEPASDPTQLVNNLEEMDITFKSEDEEMTVTRSNRTPTKPSWMIDNKVQATVIQDVTMSENIMNDKELHEMMD